MSLFKIFEAIDEEKSDVVVEDEEILSLIAKGIELRPDRKDGKTFWDDFMILLTANPELTARLLGIRRESISKWRPRIKKLLNKVTEKARGHEKKNKMLPTGI